MLCLFSLEATDLSCGGGSGDFLRPPREGPRGLQKQMKPGSFPPLRVGSCVAFLPWRTHALSCAEDQIRFAKLAG
jgi:hypothetical protein